eukprot:TRINITY_DN654_c0_g1_i1.p2 TRINITY_DN654_c0_g1~~TRINITY_DN654_c0_g1_i1.p2  ORF type:complete len:281 (+),score=63.05 TRINITY_DN654_c0_g1_i1:1427-2269(+)
MKSIISYRSIHLTHRTQHTTSRRHTRKSSSSPFDLSEKKAIITGGNGGIGLGMAKALAAQGATVCVIGRNADKNELAVQALVELNPRCFSVQGDVSDLESLKGAMKQGIDQLGGVDFCVANAGVTGVSKPLLRLSSDDIRDTFDVNFYGVLETFRIASTAMIKKRKGGSLLAISSVSADYGVQGNGGYSASKSAVENLVRTLSVELSRYQIRVNAVKPGWTRTEMTENLKKEHIEHQIPLGRWGNPDDFGGISVYLASDASKYHTGDLIKIDGGFSILKQ